MPIFAPRIIPTRMGTSFHHDIRRPTDKDHPHAYGDKSLSYFLLLSDQGSSPRVWGQAVFSAYCFPLQGIIPTRMGTSQRLYYERSGSKDHPHAYGDKEQSPVFVATERGSSPRVWGQVQNPPTKCN